jgi:hypothetical protein
MRACSPYSCTTRVGLRSRCCFGEFGNNAPRTALLGNYNELVGAANGRKLTVAVYPMPYSTTAQRRAVRDELVWAYNPARQESVPATAEVQREPRRRIGFMPDREPAR